jgi:multiple sugar transport system ATP-binding protein
MNFVNGELQRWDGELRFVARDLSQPIPQAQAAVLDGADRRQVVLGVRPEDVRVSTAAREGFEPARVFVEEPMGADVLLTVEIGGDLVKARVEAPFRTGAEQQVHVRLAPNRLHIFDAERGHALAPPPAREEEIRSAV